MRLFKRKPVLSGRRLDYRKTYWGHSIGWESGKKDTYKGHLWSSFGLKVGDRINVGAASDLLVTSVERCRDPRDMYFFTAVAYQVTENEDQAFGLGIGDYV